jgi:hypothetical protein
MWSEGTKVIVQTGMALCKRNICSILVDFEPEWYERPAPYNFYRLTLKAHLAEYLDESYHPIQSPTNTLSAPGAILHHSFLLVPSVDLGFPDREFIPWRRRHSVPFPPCSLVKRHYSFVALALNPFSRFSLWPDRLLPRHRRRLSPANPPFTFESPVHGAQLQHHALTAAIPLTPKPVTLNSYLVTRNPSPVTRNS